MENIISGAELIAPSCYVAAKMKDQPQPFNSRVELFDWFTLDEGTTLPAFSSPWWCRDFVQTCWAGDSHTMPRCLNRSVFALADVVDYLKDVKRVVFDPEATATKVWSNPRSTMSASYFCRFAKEMRPDIENLIKGAEAQVGEDWFSNPDDLLKIKELCEPSMTKVMRHAHVRTAEWEGRDSEPSQRPISGRVVPGASTCLHTSIMIVEDAFAPGTRLVDKSVNGIRSAEHEGHIQGENDGRPQQKRPPARPTSGPAKVRPDAARA